MVRTSQVNIYGKEHYVVYINDELFSEFNSIAVGEEIAQKISYTLFKKPANH